MESRGISGRRSSFVSSLATLVHISSMKEKQELVFCTSSLLDCLGLVGFSTVLVFFLSRIRIMFRIVKCCDTFEVAGNSNLIF